MTDLTRIEREHAALRASYVRVDFSTMTPRAVYEAIVGRETSLHVLTSDPGEFVRRSPYCSDLTSEQREDVVDKLRQYVRGLSTGTYRGGIRARIAICTSILRCEVPELVEECARQRIPHETMLRQIGRLKGILERLESNLRDDAIMPTDPAGVEWVDVSTRYEVDREVFEVDARVYLDAGYSEDDDDIVDTEVVALNDEREEIVDPDDVFYGSHRHIWRDAVRDAAREKACELGMCCSRCGEYFLDECSCATRREVANA